MTKETPFDWRPLGTCWDSFDPRFFPKRGQSTKWPKKMCRECLVREECLEDAINRREPAGIRGEMSTRERQAIIRERRKQ